MNAKGPDKASTEEVSGLIECVTFHNEENGFCVLRVKVRGHGDEMTVLGSLPSVSAGEWPEADGWWVRDKEHGLQFKARLMKTVLFHHLYSSSACLNLTLTMIYATVPVGPSSSFRSLGSNRKVGRSDLEGSAYTQPR
jgi:hypothetical protein